MRRDADAATPQALAGTSSPCWVADWGQAAQPGDQHPAGQTDELIEELPVALVYNGVSHAVMLASPVDLADFAIGFSLTEGIVQGVHEVRDVEVVAGCDGIELQLTIASERMAALTQRRRALAGRTGCGLCGVETLAQALRPVRQVGPGAPPTPLTASALAAAWQSVADAQALHRATGAAHAAGFASWEGELLLLREDVGRHNALDKLIGAMAQRRLPGSAGFTLVTSRASYEMVHKAAAAGISLLAALSAPTALAVRSARQAGMSLLGFAGRAQPRVYAHPQRIA